MRGAPTRERRRGPARLGAQADIGLVAALGSALAYGITVVIGRDLARDGFGGTPVLACRFGIAALFLVAVQTRRGSLLPAQGERLRSAGLGVLYALQASMFFAALGRGSAAAVSLVFYSYPAMVAGVELARRTLRWSARIGTAMALSVGGVLTVIAVEGQLSISAAGVAYGLAAAALFALFVLSGKQLVQRTEATIRALWTTSAAALTLTGLALGAGDKWPDAGRLPALGAYGIATAAAFGLVFVALRRIGPTRTSVVLNFEVVAAVALAAVFLDEQLSALQALGGAAVIAGAILAAKEPS